MYWQRKNFFWKYVSQLIYLLIQILTSLKLNINQLSEHQFVLTIQRSCERVYLKCRTQNKRSSLVFPKFFMVSNSGTNTPRSGKDLMNY